MRVEAHINGKELLIEVPSGGGIDKGGVARTGDPNAVLDNVTNAVRIVAVQVGRALEMEAYVPPVAMEVQFAVKVDDKAFVSVGMTPEDGQFRVTLKYDA